MKNGLQLSRNDRRRAATLAVIILVQALCAAFFFSDVVSDFKSDKYLSEVHFYMEAIATLVLIAGVVFLMIELRKVMTRMEQLDRGLRGARGEMAEIIDAFFEEWDLTPSEKDVGLLILKGFDNEAISQLRGTAAGTVRAQSTRIYSKAGVESRAQLFSVFLDELLAGEGRQDGADLKV